MSPIVIRASARCFVRALVCACALLAFATAEAGAATEFYGVNSRAGLLHDPAAGPQPLPRCAPAACRSCAPMRRGARSSRSRRSPGCMPTPGRPRTASWSISRATACAGIRCSATRRPGRRRSPTISRPPVRRHGVRDLRRGGRQPLRPRRELLGRAPGVPVAANDGVRDLERALERHLLARRHRLTHALHEPVRGGTRGDPGRRPRGDGGGRGHARLGDGRRSGVPAGDVDTRPAGSA